jgi:hypothetical protein
MARKEARVFTSIWMDSDFVALPPEAQRMYLFLLSQPELSLCGRLQLAENQWATTAEGLTKAKVRAELTRLASTAPPFIVVDYASDELLIRSFVRRDRILVSPKLIKPLVSAVSIIRSENLRRVLRDELLRARDEGDIHETAADAVDSMIKQLDTLSDRVSHTLRDRVQEKGVGEEVTCTGSQQGEVMELCVLLADRIEANGSKRPTITKAWLNACRLLIEKDGRTPTQVRKAILWSQQDSFWMGNIMSMPKLREQYDKLRLAAQRSQ